MHCIITHSFDLTIRATVTASQVLSSSVASRSARFPACGSSPAVALFSFVYGEAM